MAVRPRIPAPSPPLTLAALTCALGLAFAVARGPLAVGQATLNGLIAGSTFALGAIGLTLVFGVLRLVNFAHGDFLTFGAYTALAFGALGVPFVAAVTIAMVATAALGLLLESVLWQPMRRAGANTLQLFLAAIGLALVIRYGVQFFAGSQVRSLGIDTISSVGLGGLHIAIMQLVLVVVGLATMLAVGLALRFSWLGKQMRALADNAMLAEVTGIDTRRVVLATWAVAGGLAGLAGVLYAASIGSMNPNLGATVLLGLFAAAVLGGIGHAYGALAGGLVIGLAQEWATLFVNARWKPAVGFAILILALLAWPRGIFGARRAS